MFDQLDDPRPPTADRGRYDRVVERATAIRHRRRRRTARIAAGTIAAGVLGVVGFASYDAHRLGGVQKVSVAAHLTPASSDGAQTFLLVGTDRGVWDGTTTAGADSIMAVRIDPATHAAVALQLPRDLRVPASSGGLTPKLSEVYRTGGPSALLAALHHGLGLDVQHYLSIDPAGFVDLVDLVGGTRIKSDRDLRETPLRLGPGKATTGLTLSANSCTGIDGTTALELARTRHVQTRDESGNWTNDPTGDIGRVQRQAVISQALLGSFRSMDVHDPLVLHHLVDALVAHATVDSGLGAGSLIRLAEQVHDLRPDAVTFEQLPTAAGFEASSPQMWLDLAQGWQDAVGRITSSDTAPTSTVPAGPTSSTPPPLAVPAAQLAVC